MTSVSSKSNKEQRTEAESETQEVNGEEDRMHAPPMPFNLSSFPPVCVYVHMWLHDVVIRPDSALRGAQTSATSIRHALLDAVPCPDRVPLPPSA